MSELCSVSRGLTCWVLCAVCPSPAVALLLELENRNVQDAVLSRCQLALTSQLPNRSGCCLPKVPTLAAVLGFVGASPGRKRPHRLTPLCPLLFEDQQTWLSGLSNKIVQVRYKWILWIPPFFVPTECRVTFSSGNSDSFKRTAWALRSDKYPCFPPVGPRAL